ncbi:hypothetical protein [Prochlorococcus marinus]|uniref:Methylenetetrahydrofolate reductase (NAD(P)H) n=1 Tax=Prochlorococcus marinus XMU1408 TaxID=2213228 RepID=A0A318R0N9_PROMR|nr:hypothetical protein [Prochlorococcus marinus]MBW3041720.1 hypothetical protein [Prochlorococcus marinus str. XMU1408]PYE02866.1 hypothetical protein DNJ73_03720 [Prochlorococcus marinus XMU1408]
MYNLNNIRTEISFKSFDELRSTLSFYKKNDLCKINIPCKNNLKKDFLLDSIKIATEEFPNIDFIPHFSIMHEFKRNSLNTQQSFIEFVKTINNLGCHELLLVSGSQKRSTLDSVSALEYVKDNTLFSKIDFSIGVAFNPYLPTYLFNDEILRLEKKLKSGLVTSIWIQFGTDYTLLESRMIKLKNIIHTTIKNPLKISNINIFASILIPSKQFLSRFKYRPWKGVYCSNEFLESVELANYTISKLLCTYKKYEIFPLIETPIASEYHLENLMKILKI